MEIPKPEISQEEFREIQIQTLDDNIEKRLDAIKYLQNIANLKAVNVLISVLTFDKNSTVRGAAAVALGKLKAKEAIPLLKNVSKEDEDSEVRRLALFAIRDIES